MLVGIYQQSQRAQLIDLLIELAQHYNVAHQATRAEVAAHLDATITSPGSPVTLATAVDATGRVVGLAALIVMPSIVEAVGAQRLQCNLKELYVTQHERSAGAGTALLRWAARFAADQGCGRLDFHVKATNTAGIRLYERHGARTVGDRVSYRIESDALADLAAPECPA
jgi:ribosomal protein S18 acetylase RimI-like enzyme